MLPYMSGAYVLTVGAALAQVAAVKMKRDFYALCRELLGLPAIGQAASRAARCAVPAGSQILTGTAPPAHPPQPPPPTAAPLLPLPFTPYLPASLVSARSAVQAGTATRCSQP